MASSLQAFVLNRYPTPCFSVAEFALAALALGPLPSFVPLVLLLTVLRVHGQRIARRQTRGRELLCSWIAITAGSALAHWRAAASALSNPTESLVAIVLLSASTYSIVVVAIYLDVRLKGLGWTDWAQITLFPALWAACWAITSRISPVGRLLNWWPAPVPSSYDWMLPLTGPAGIDWIVGAWAVVCSELVGQWLMGFAEHEALDAHGNDSLMSSRSKGLVVLVTTLLALTFPSSVLNVPPLHSDISVLTPLTVGCVLPSPLDGRRLRLEDYVKDTSNMNSANVILWPESAVVFNTAKERSEAFAKIRNLNLSALIGVAFDEYVAGDPAHSRNGFALVHKDQKPDDVDIQYYKRNLVPFTESFAKIPSVEPPVITRWQLKNPKGITKPRWGTRPLLVTSSICLDFTSPTVFTNLDARPTLILGPARTWDTTVGLAMWEQARARANELGSMVLWCDGGMTGISGIGGGGIHEPMQSGGGSWMRTIGVAHPVVEHRTVYATIGDFTVIVVLLGLMGGDVGSGLILRWAKRGGMKAVGEDGAHEAIEHAGRHASSTEQTLKAARRRRRRLFSSSSSSSSQVRAVSKRARTYTTSAHNFLQSKLPRGLRGSLRSSTSFDPSRLLARAFPLFAKKQAQPPPDENADFELVASDDVPPADDHPLLSDSPEVTTPPQPPPISRTKSTLFRLKNISKASIHLSSFTDSRASSSRTRTATDESDICLTFPKPPTHIPSSPLSPPPPPPPPPAGPSRSIQKIPLKRAHRFTGSLKHFKSLSQILRDSFVSHPVDASSVDTIRSRKPWNDTPPSDPAIPPVPSLPPHLPCRNNTQTTSSPPTSIASLPEESSPAPIHIPPPLRRKHSAPAELGSPTTHYQLVNPSELTASPSSLARSSLALVNPSARSSFLPPSPSWLSRNVNSFDPADLSATFPPSRISALSDSEHLKFPEITSFYPSALFAPDSPHPLPIPPPRVPVQHPQSFQPRASPSRPVLHPLRTNVTPESPESETGSFVTSPTPLESTLYSPSSSATPTTAFASALPSPSPQFRRQLSSISQISAERHRQSITRLKRSRASSPRTYRQPSLKASRTSLNPALKDRYVRNHLSNGPKFHLLKAPPSPVTCESSDQRTIFVPSKQRDSPLSKQSPLPKDLALLLEGFFVQSGLLDSFARPPMDYTAKNQDVVDFGGEVDYSGHQWFQEPPPRPEPPPVVQPYIPGEEVIQQNKAFVFALEAAPNVLYGRFKQYGQLGVLAWCSEFGEMIDSLKELGFSGNMFTATRTQALQTCEELLKLKMDIKMQIILMYLSSQVARLRRFLDGGEHLWDDYPTPEFPLDYRAYSS